MAPFDRRPKVSNPSRPVSGFDARANSNKTARAPWEREDDDEFGPPPALDQSPGDAESEAKRMIYEKKHPLHDAITQSGHINHNHAMRRYSSLIRRAHSPQGDPAARTIPVQPARDPANADDRAVASIQAPSSRAPLVPSGPATRVPGTPIAANDATRAVTKNQMADVASSNAPLQPQDNRLHKAGGTQIAQTTPPDGSVDAHTDARAQPPRPQDFGRKGEQVDVELLQDASYGLHSTRERERWHAIAMSSLSAAERLREPVKPTVPHSINETRFAEATQLVYARDDLSEVMKYSLLRIFGYEDTSVNSANQSRAGLLTSTYQKDWGRLEPFVDQIRNELGKPELNEDEVVADLSLDDIIDAQKAYLILALVDLESQKDMRNQIDAGTIRISDFDPLADFGTGELPAQIADTVYRHGGTGGLKIVQRAIDQVIASLPDAERARLELPASIEVDGIMGDITYKAIKVLASSDAMAAGFLSAIQFERAREMSTNNEYRGADRRRVWGWHEDRPGL